MHVSRHGFLPISSELDSAEVGAVRVAVVGLGARDRGDTLDSWYSLPDTGAQAEPGNKVPHPHTCSCIILPLFPKLL